MAILNFQKQFAVIVALGVKRQTIRARRKYPIREGEDLALYTGLRTKSSELLRKARCLYARDISMDVDIDGRPEIIIAGYGPLSYEEKKDLAMKDGFSSIDRMLVYFRGMYGLPFEGQLIKW
jgi:hypothetical protein